MIYFLLIALIVGIDQGTKYLVLQNFDPGQSIPLAEGVFHLTYVQNHGAAFSILQGKPLFFIVLNLLIVSAIAVLIVLRRKKAHPLLLSALAMIAAGGCGNNLIDRLRLGYVVDFIDFRIWPVFNVADISVTVGAGLLIWYVVVWEPKIRRKSAGAP